MAAPLFDSYIMVDWSAASKPVTGANSIWIAALERSSSCDLKLKTRNIPTRFEAVAFLHDVLAKHIEAGRRILLGFDFALGYPSGTARAAGLDISVDPPWRAMHRHLAQDGEPKPDNSNARFATAATLNKAITGTSHPFWGAPKSKIAPTLNMTKGNFSAPESLPEHRLCEAWIRQSYAARPKSVWQLAGAGAVGSQSLLGIPVIDLLRQAHNGLKLWPFETGFRQFDKEELHDTTCLIAEVYPSTLSPDLNRGDILDKVQVEALCKHFGTLDSSGKLAKAFAPPPGLTHTEIHKIEVEEAWILTK